MDAVDAPGYVELLAQLQQSCNIPEFCWLVNECSPNTCMWKALTTCSWRNRVYSLVFHYHYFNSCNLECPKAVNGTFPAHTTLTLPMRPVPQILSGGMILGGMMGD